MPPVIVSPRPVLRAVPPPARSRPHRTTKAPAAQRPPRARSALLRPPLDALHIGRHEAARFELVVVEVALAPKEPLLGVVRQVPPVALRALGHRPEHRPLRRPPHQLRLGPPQRLFVEPQQVLQPRHAPLLKVLRLLRHRLLLLLLLRPPERGRRRALGLGHSRAQGPPTRGTGGGGGRGSVASGLSGTRA